MKKKIFKGIIIMLAAILLLSQTSLVLANDSSSKVFNYTGKDINGNECFLTVGVDDNGKINELTFTGTKTVSFYVPGPGPSSAIQKYQVTIDLFEDMNKNSFKQTLEDSKIVVTAKTVSKMPNTKHTFTLYGNIDNLTGLKYKGVVKTFGIPFSWTSIEVDELKLVNLK